MMPHKNMSSATMSTGIITWKNSIVDDKPTHWIREAVYKWNQNMTGFMT